MKGHAKCTSEAQYEERGGVTSSHVAMEENLAYQSVNAGATKP